MRLSLVTNNYSKKIKKPVKVYKKHKNNKRNIINVLHAKSKIARCFHIEICITFCFFFFLSMINK